MPNYRVQWTIETSDGNAANFATNTIYCSAPTLGDMTAAIAQWITFYQAVDTYFSTLVKTNLGLKYKVYDMADAEPRAPVSFGSQSMSVGAGDPLPTEVALAVSYQALQQSGVPQARRRGRFFLPFMVEGNNDSQGRPATAMVNAIVAAADTLVTASKASATWKWVVYSPTSGQFTVVDNGWVDNEWDTQRRRGRIADTRTTFS